MKVELVDLNKIIEINNVLEVTDPIGLDYLMMPTDGGLYSYRIFGKLAGDRKHRFGYIDLKKRFINPIIYNTLVSVQRNILGLIKGEQEYKITADGDLVPVGKDERGGTGIGFLYDNWNKIKFKYTTKSQTDDENASELRKIRVDLLSKTHRDVCFMDKWLVIPAFYRDINSAQLEQGRISVDELNDKYTKLINLTRNLSQDLYGFSFSAIYTETLIQSTIMDIYDYFKSKLEKKNGVVHDKLMSKSIDFSSRSVIISPKMRFETPDDNPIDYSHTGVPLSHLCSLYYPLITTTLYNFLEERMGNIKTDDLAPDFRNDFSLKHIQKIIKNFIKTPHMRLDPLSVRDKKNKPKEFFIDYFTKNMRFKTKETNSDIAEYIIDNWLVLVYLLMDEIIQDKFLVISRYPIDNYQNTYISRINILTTAKTEQRKLWGKIYRFFPIIPEDHHAIEYIDAVRFSSSYLSTLNADFDGDTISIRSLYSQEANAELGKLMKSKLTMLSLSGKCNRGLKNEGVMGMYVLTKD